MDKCLASLRTDRIAHFKTVFDTLKDIIIEGTWHFAADGMRLQGTDPGSLVHIDFRIRPEMLEESGR